MGIDEEGTLERLGAHRREVIDPAIAAHKGRTVKLMGDGALVEFASVVDAARCMAEIQEAMAARNASGDQDRRMDFRIGVHVGDVIIEGKDIFSDGVNIAARLQEIAAPGGICLSGDVHRQVRGKLDAEFEDLGEQRLKNIAEPVRVYRWHANAGTEILPLPKKSRRSPCCLSSTRAMIPIRVTSRTRSRKTSRSNFSITATCS